MLVEGRCWLVEASHHDDSSGDALGRGYDRREQVPAPVRPVAPPGWGPFRMDWARTAAAILASLVGQDRPRLREDHITKVVARSLTRTYVRYTGV